MLYWKMFKAFVAIAMIHCAARIIYKDADLTKAFGVATVDVIKKMEEKWGGINAD